MSRFVKEFNRLLKNLEKKTNGQALIKSYDEHAMTSFIVELSPSDGPYQHGKFLFQIQASEYYPDSPPDVVCITDIYHPNIDGDLSVEHNICLNLFDEWSRTFGLEDCIQGLLFLLYHPNISDPVSSYFDVGMDYTTFLRNVEKSLRGEPVDGYTIQINYGWDEHQQRMQQQQLPESQPKGDACDAECRPIIDGVAIRSQPLGTEPKCASIIDQPDSDSEPISSEAASHPISHPSDSKPISDLSDLLQVSGDSDSQPISDCQWSMTSQRPQAVGDNSDSQPNSDAYDSQPISDGSDSQPISDELDPQSISDDSSAQPISSESDGQPSGEDSSCQPIGAEVADDAERQVDSGRPDSPSLSFASDNLDELMLDLGDSADGGQPRDFVFCRFRPAEDADSSDSSGNSSARSDSSLDESSSPMELSAGAGRLPVTLRVGDSSLHVFASRRFPACVCVRVNSTVVHPGASRLLLRQFLAVGADSAACGAMVAGSDLLTQFTFACLRHLLLQPLL